MRKEKQILARQRDLAKQTAASEKVQAGKQADHANKALDAVNKNGRHFASMKTVHSPRYT